MQDHDEFEYRYSLTFPSAKAYAVDDVFTLIALADYEYTHSAPMERIPFFAPKWASEIDDSHCASGERAERAPSGAPRDSAMQKKHVDDYRLFLQDRLLKAVIDGQFELWDWTGDKVIDPPKNSLVDATLSPEDFSPSYRPVYQTNVWWARMASIFKSDLVKFCRGIRIHALFEDEQASNQVAGAAPVNHASPATDVVPSSVDQCSQRTGIDQPQAPAALAAPAASIATEHPIGKADPRPPGKMPNVNIGKLAIAAAWEIECATGLPASPKAVLKKLQQWAEEKKEHWLGEPTKTGLTWTSTETLGENEYGIWACRKTLQRWHSSRKLL